MIEKAQAYKTVDGVTHATLTEAQSHALGQLVGTGEAVMKILEHSESIIAILKLKPRKSRVAKKPKAPKVPKVA